MITEMFFTLNIVVNYSFNKTEHDALIKLFSFSLGPAKSYSRLTIENDLYDPRIEILI